MTQTKSYSPVILVTGAGCSVPYGFPDMRGFAQELYGKLKREGIPQPMLDLIARILYGTSSPGEEAPPVSDLEGLLVALTSISQYPTSDNPAVSVFMALASEASTELSDSLSALLKTSTELTDMIPLPKPSPHVPPHRFGGVATLDGRPVAAGIAVTAVIDGKRVAAAGARGGGAYLIDVVQPEGASYAGKIVTFNIGTAKAAETATWVLGGATVVNLTAVTERSRTVTPMAQPIVTATPYIGAAYPPFPAQVTSQAIVLGEVASKARSVLGRWQGRTSNYREHAAHMLDRVKTTISGRYSFCDPQSVESRFDPVIQALLSHCYGYLDLFTLNYDPSVEVYCLSKGVSIANGFSTKGLEMIWANHFEASSSPAIRLYKLHGSVTWYTYEGKIVQTTAGLGTPQIATITGIQAQNMLIYPILAKPTWSEPYLSLFSHLSEALNTAHCCVVIGFSYGDEGVVSALHQAYARNPGLKIVHCGMGMEQAKRIEHLRPLLPRMEFMEKLYGQDGFIEELNGKLTKALG